MGFTGTRLLNVVIWLPAAFALLVAMLPKGEKGQIRTLTLVGMLGSLLSTLWAFGRFEARGLEFQLEYRLRWMDELGLSYHLGVDGLAVTLVLLTGVLGPLVVLSSWSFVEERVKEFHLALLLLQTAMLGALCSLDVLLFYVFFEAMLVPMYLLIGVWGSEERQAAAMKFFLYTLVGSVLMLIALLGVYFIANPAGQRSFDYAQLYNGLMEANRQVALCTANGAEGCAGLAGAARSVFLYGPWMFFAFCLAFAIKVPMWPLHTWLPDAHVQAPVAGSMVLAGVMLKMGTFGFWRFAIPLFPVQARTYQGPIAVLAVIGIVYGALMCLAQRDVKKLIAYSSVSHLGYCMLGIVAFTAEGATGSAYQMINHGVSTGALFLLFGMLYERRHARQMSDFGGLAKVMPVFTAFFLLITFSSIAVPGTNGFVGEFLVLLGTFKSNLPLAFGFAAGTAVVLGAAYMLWMVQKVFFGPVTHRENALLSDMGRRELLSAIPFAVLVLVMGLRPQPILDLLNRSTERYLARANFAAGGDEKRARVSVLPLPELPPTGELRPAPPTAQLDPARLPQPRLLRLGAGTKVLPSPSPSPDGN